VTQVGLLLSGPSSNWEFMSSRDLFTSLNLEIPTLEHSGTRHQWRCCENCTPVVVAHITSADCDACALMAVQLLADDAHTHTQSVVGSWSIPLYGLLYSERSVDDSVNTSTLSPSRSCV